MRWALLLLFLFAGPAAAAYSPDTINSAENLTKLRGIPVPVAADIKCIQRLGYAAVGDGGGGLYCWNATSTATDDGGYAVNPNGHSGAGRWILQGPIFSVLSWGANRADGADAGPAWQAAYAAMSPSGACITVPAGVYKIATQVVMSAMPPCFRGGGYNEAPNGGTKTGTWVHIASTSLQPFAISSQTASGQGSGFFEMAFFNDQPAPGAGWAPSAYQYIFQVNGGGNGLTFDRLYFYNTTHCLSALSSGRLHLTNWAGQPVGTCILIDNFLDTMFIDNIDLWPNWTNGGGPGLFRTPDPKTIDPGYDVIKYTQANVDPIVLRRVDSPAIGDVFVLGYRSGIKFEPSTYGSPATGVQINNLQVDAAKYGIWVNSTNVTAQFANVRTSAGNWNGVGYIPGSNGYLDDSAGGNVVNIANFNNFTSGGNAVKLAGASNLSIANPILWGYNADNNGSTGFSVASGGIVSVGTCPQVANVTFPAPLLGGVGKYAGCFRQTWTPALAGSGGSGTPAYTSQIGDYWFDGTKVTVTFNITYTGALSGFSGSMTVGGLPFAATSATGHGGVCNVNYYSAITLTSGYTQLSGVVPPTSTSLQFIQGGSNQSATNVPTSGFGSGGTVSGSCTYPAF
jgi:hypothetical protein